MGSFRFPFNWGSVPSGSASTTATASASTARWTVVGATAKGWIETGVQVHRFERIYEQPRGVFGQSINFSFKIATQFPFKIQSGTQVRIISTITSP